MAGRHFHSVLPDRFSYLAKLLPFGGGHRNIVLQVADEGIYGITLVAKSVMNVSSC